MTKVTSLMAIQHEEGAGSFYQRPFLVNLFAKANDLQFIRANNFPSISHYEDGDGVAINQMWNEIFQFLGDPVEMHRQMPLYITDATHSKDTVYNVPFGTAYQYLDKLDIAKRDSYLKEVRNVFNSKINKFPHLAKQDSGEFIIALHLRDSSKGDPPKSLKLIDWQLFSYDYGLPDNNPHYYARLYASNINRIINERRIMNPVLHIHSTGNIDTFSELVELLDQKIKVQFFLNHPAPLSFLALVYADILIASHSSFSWLALLLRSGPSYIRKGFRHFLTQDTSILKEVLFSAEQTPLQRLYLKAKLKMNYWLFNKKLKRIKS